MKEKDILRRQSALARKHLAKKDRLSLQIMERLLSLEAYRTASAVLWYLDIREEVRTRSAVRTRLGESDFVAVPYCDGDELQLFRLRAWDDLAPGAFGILEPQDSLRHLDQHRIPPEQIDCVIVPGVAFDTRGGRLGHGRGFYDRLFSRMSSAVTRIGLAFECQLHPKIPMETHDMRMNLIVTERRVVSCDGRLGVRADAQDC